MSKSGSVKQSLRGGAKSARIMFTPKTSDRKSRKLDADFKSVRSHNTKADSPIKHSPKHMERPTLPDQHILPDGPSQGYHTYGNMNNKLSHHPLAYNNYCNTERRLRDDVANINLATFDIDEQLYPSMGSIVGSEQTLRVKSITRDTFEESKRHKAVSSFTQSNLKGQSTTSFAKTERLRT